MGFDQAGASATESALRAVARDGDVAPAGDMSPAASTLRQRLELDNLVRWDPFAGRLVLTSSGVARLAASGRPTADVISFPAARRG